MYAFSFTPKTDAEIQEIKNRTLLADGIYPFTVKSIESQISSNNNPMLMVRIGVLDASGAERVIKDYLLTTEKMIYKLKHFCDTIGFQDEYSKGSFLPEKIVGRSGDVRIGIEKGNLKEDRSGFYPDKNAVKDYLIAPRTEQKKSVEIEPTLNDDINF